MSILLKTTLCGCRVEGITIKIQPDTLPTSFPVTDQCVLISGSDSPFSPSSPLFLLSSLRLCFFSSPSPPRHSRERRSPSVGAVRPSQTLHLLVRATFTSILHTYCLPHTAEHNVYKCFKSSPYGS